MHGIAKAFPSTFSIPHTLHLQFSGYSSSRDNDPSFLWCGGRDFLDRPDYLLDQGIWPAEIRRVAGILVIEEVQLDRCVSAWGISSHPYHDKLGHVMSRVGRAMQLQFGVSGSILSGPGLSYY